MEKECVSILPGMEDISCMERLDRLGFFTLGAQKAEGQSYGSLQNYKEQETG